MSGNDYIIKGIYPVNDSEWLLQCSNCPFATFFHTPIWARSFEKWSGGKIKAKALLFEFNDNTHVLLPIAEKKVGWLKIGISMPASTYGGWISGENLESEKVDFLLKLIRKKYKDLLLVVNPFDSSISNLTIKNADNCYTSVIDLRNGLQSVIQNSKYHHKKNIKTAERAGVQVEFSEDFSNWVQYYEIYEKSVRRWKEKELFSGVKYDLNLFEIIYKLEPLHRKLWIAVLDGKVISGILCFYWNKHAVAWHGAGLSEFFNHRPNDLLYQHAIENACNAGFHWFDCNPSGGLDGVSNFKQGLGAVAFRTMLIDQRSTVRKLASLIRNR